MTEKTNKRDDLIDQRIVINLMRFVFFPISFISLYIHF